MLGGFVTTLLSWRVGFLLEALIIAVVLSGSGIIRDVPYTGERSIDGVGAMLSVVGMGGMVLGVLVWQEGGESVAALLVVGLAAMGALVYWLLRRKRKGSPSARSVAVQIQAVQPSGTSKESFSRLRLVDC